MKRLEVKNFYKKGDLAAWSTQEYESYKDSQIQRQQSKSSSTRNKTYYQSCAKFLTENISNFQSIKMLCLGTRNNWERDQFREYLQNNDVYSVDISPSAKPDYVVDFNTISDKILETWDVIFTNSIDHAINPAASYLDWLKCLKKDGYLIVDFESRSDLSATNTDCSIFSRESIESFLEDLQKTKQVEVVFCNVNIDIDNIESSGYTDGYFRTIVRKS